MNLVNQNQNELELASYAYNYMLLPSIHNMIGRLHVANNKADLAEAEFKAAISADPDYADAHYNLGVLHNLTYSNSSSF